jgi:hypothetical protein
MRILDRLLGLRAAASIGLAFLLLLRGPSLRAAEKVYETDFQRGKVSPQWSFNQVEEYANRQRFLGPLSNQTVHLRLEKLPKHAFIRIHFDLIIAWNWEGSTRQQIEGEPRRGPEVIQLAVQNGPVLMRGSFSNQQRDPYRTAVRQSFPELDERILVPQRTGSRELDNFTPKMNDFGNNNLLLATATHYRQNWTLPHSKNELTLEFSAENLQEVEEQFWGIDNVAVEVLSADEVPALEAAQLAEMPKLLSGSGSAIAATACWDLVAHPEQALQVIRQMKTEMLRADPTSLKRQARIQELIRGLDSSVYADRVEALRGLEEFGSAAAATVTREEKASRSPETRERLRELLSRWSATPNPVQNPQALQRMRCTRILEIIDSKESLELAKQLRVD